MEPVGLGAVSHAPAHDEHEPHTEEAPPPPKDRAALLPDTGFTMSEILGVGLWLVIMAAILFATAVAMVVGVWVFHWIFHQILPNNFKAAEAWGNAVGTILVIVLGFVMILATLLTMGERKWSALIQDRLGPNQARLPIPGLKDKALWGLPHIAADVLKMLTKEELVPALSNKIVFQLAPALAFAPPFVLFAVIPMSPTFELWGYNVTMLVAPVDQGLLYIFAIASIAVFGTTLAGWASNNKFALLGGVRATAQMISYEVTLGLTVVGLMIIYKTLRLDTMSEAQGAYLWNVLPAWGIFFQPLAIFTYFAASHAEMKRIPFDLPEGESEIVGYFIEYSGLKFGLFMIAELVEVVVFAGLFTVLFFGGYHLPWGEAWLQQNVPAAVQKILGSGAFAHGLATGMMGFIYVTSFLTKTVFFCWLSLATRWTYPRFRYDQVMDLGWKLLLPISLANVVLTGIVVLAWGLEGAAIVGLIEIAIVLFYIISGLTISRTGHETLLPTRTAPAAAAGHHGGHH
jgi:NADH-quinone oxidoreductase subunit H